MSKELTIKSEYHLADPKSMAKMATVLKDHIIKHELFTKIVGKNYVNVEGWQFAGGLLGSFPRIKAVTNLSTASEVKWQAEVEIINSATNTVVSTGFAVCSNKEVKKKTFDEYAVLSMAQTRAIGKAYRNVIGWVIKLAGYEATPKEEVSKIGEEDITINVGVEESGIQEETQQIQETLTILGFTTPTRQLQFVKKFCEKKGYKYDAWKMTKKVARELLGGLLKMKLEK